MTITIYSSFVSQSNSLNYHWFTSKHLHITLMYSVSNVFRIVGKEAIAPF